MITSAHNPRLQHVRALLTQRKDREHFGEFVVEGVRLVEEALAAATEGDLTLFDRLVEVVSQPFDARPGLARYAEPAPESFGHYQTFCGT